MKNENNLDRRLEISEMFIQMGQALMKEGAMKNDFSIRQNGSIIVMLAGIILDEDDTYEFGNLCSMYSAKKLLSGMENSNSDMANFMKDGIVKNDELKNIIEDYIKKRKGKKGGEDTPKE
jgi:hypothetical protein